MPPIKILHVVHSLEPGGLENGIVNLSRALDARAFETHVFCLQNSGEFSNRLKDPGNIYAQRKGPGFSPQATWALNRNILRLKPQIVHSHNLGPLIYAGLATALGRLRPLLHGEHSQLTIDERTPPRMRQRKWFYRTCQRVHTVSNSLRLDLIKLGFPPAKLVSIPNGVDTDRFSPCLQTRIRVRTTLGIPSSARVIGIVGRFGKYKQHSVLIDAFSKLASRMPDLHLVIVGGGGPEEAAVRSQAKESFAANRIHLLGFQDRAEDYYRCMDLLVVPSINEGLSNAVLESMACGVPALSHLACGSAEAISHGEEGYLADLSNSESLEAQIANVLQNSSTLSALGTKARTRVMSHFSLLSMTKAYAELYWALLSQNRDAESSSGREH